METGVVTYLIRSRWETEELSSTAPLALARVNASRPLSPRAEFTFEEHQTVQNKLKVGGGGCNYPTP